MINKENQKYVEEKIIPKYETFDKGHDVSHVKTVIEESLKLAKSEKVNPNLAYVIGAYHDLGLINGREFHHIDSGSILLADNNLKKWFSNNEILIMKEAVEDHRASSKNPPRTIYGKIVAEADRDIVPIKIIRRTIQYSLKNTPSPDKEVHWQHLVEHMAEKYAQGGYMRLWFESSKNALRLNELRAIIENKNLLREIFEELYSQEV